MHSVAASKSASSYPSSHGKHCELPAGAKLPKEHDVHDADPTTSENVPGAHCTQELDAAADDCPIGQSVQLIPLFSTSARPAVPGVAHRSFTPLQHSSPFVSSANVATDEDEHHNFNGSISMNNEQVQIAPVLR